MPRPRILFARQWRIPKIMLALLIIEFPLTVANLALMGIADPNTYRTKMWQNGADKGFNSDPVEILYSYANYRPIAVPLVWSAFMTKFNVVISVLSMFLLLTKAAMYVLGVLLPAISVFIHIGLVAIYAVAIRNQSAPDLTDPAHPSPGLPWYLSKGCKYAEPGNVGYCQQAAASFYVTIVMTLLFVTYLVYSIWCSFPTEREKNARHLTRQSDMEMKDIMKYGDELTKQEKKERDRQAFLNLPKTPKSPGFGLKDLRTPRTIAFSRLTGETPAKKPEVRTEVKPIAGPSTVSPGPSSRPLPFREYSDGV